MAKTIYYHVLEYGSYGNIGWQGCYDTKEEAEKEANRLQGFFPNQTFEVWMSNSKKEPEIVTI